MIYCIIISYSLQFLYMAIVVYAPALAFSQGKYETTIAQYTIKYFIIFYVNIMLQHTPPQLD